jgi:hypothetical protein
MSRKTIGPLPEEPPRPEGVAEEKAPRWAYYCFSPYVRPPRWIF